MRNFEPMSIMKIHPMKNPDQYETIFASNPIHLIRIHENPGIDVTVMKNHSYPVSSITNYEKPESVSIMKIHPVKNPDQHEIIFVSNPIHLVRIHENRIAVYPDENHPCPLSQHPT